MTDARSGGRPERPTEHRAGNAGRLEATRAPGHRAGDPGMVGRYPGEVVPTVCVLFAPAILLFGLYVIAHGHYGPGGGFAGGVALAVGVIMLRVTVDERASARVFPPPAAIVVGGLGMGLFALSGVVPLAAGGGFLDYAAVPLGVADATLRYLGILVVEVAIGFAVLGAMVLVFDVLVGRTD
jgi:multicomponent Na+:H+ antiporter subunit B